VTRRWDDLLERVDDIREKIAHLGGRTDGRADILEAIMTVRDPSAVSAGEAYDGLRRQVVNSVSQRTAHLSQLVQFERAVTGGATPAELTNMIESWFEQAGLERVSVMDPGGQLFELVEDLGGAVEILEPAYVDMNSGRVVRRGRARRVAVRAEAATSVHLDGMTTRETM
jgi:hypothetical protein